MKQLWREHGVVPKDNGSLPPDRVRAAARAAGLTCHDLRSRTFPTIEQFANWMLQSAIAAFGRYQCDGGDQIHVIVFYGLTGNGEVSHTDVAFVDPTPGPGITAGTACAESYGHEYRFYCGPLRALPTRVD